jgi:3-methylcrotonyl-CoA carboxylase beta subunit
MGSCTAGGAYVPAMSDETIIVKNQGTIFLGGPPLVKAATGEVVSAEDLGGGDVHTRLSGVADHLAENDLHALALARRRWANLNWRKPQQLLLQPPRPPKYAAELHGVIPADPASPTTCARSSPASSTTQRVRRVQGALRHHAGVRLRPHRGHAGGHRRQQRHPVRRERQQGRALHRAVLPAQDAARLPAEHHRLHGRPQVRERGHRPRRRQDGHRGGLRQVPKFTVIIGGSFGAGNYGMCGRAYSPRFLWMWPNARISVMGGEQAASVLATVRATASRPRAASGRPPRKSASAPIREQYERQGHPYYASARLWDDGVIDPADTRRVLALGCRPA